MLCLSMRESRPSQLLRNHVGSVARDTGYEDLRINKNDEKPDIKAFLSVSLTLPIRLFFLEPIVCMTVSR